MKKWQWSYKDSTNRLHFQPIETFSAGFRNYFSLGLLFHKSAKTRENYVFYQGCSRKNFTFWAALDKKTIHSFSMLES